MYESLIYRYLMKSNKNIHEVTRKLSLSRNFIL